MMPQLIYSAKRKKLAIEIEVSTQPFVHGSFVLVVVVAVIFDEGGL